MKTVFASLLVLAAVSAPLNAKAVTMEELIKQKQANAQQLQRGSAQRIQELRNNDSSHPSLISGGYGERNLYDLETASGDTDENAPKSTNEPSPVAASESTAPAASQQNAKPVEAKNPVKTEPNLAPASGTADQLKEPLPPTAPNGVI